MRSLQRKRFSSLETSSIKRDMSSILGEGDSLTHLLFLILKTELDLGQVCGDWTVRIWGQDSEGGSEPVSDERNQM